MTFFSSKVKKKHFLSGRKLTNILLIFTLALIIIMPLKPARAQMIVWDAQQSVWENIKSITDKLWQKGGSLAFQQTLRTALNKIAYDSANWIGSGGKGQKPLFITQDWGAYLKQTGDEAAGNFLENFSKNLAASATKDKTKNSINGCEVRSNNCTDKCVKKEEDLPCFDSCTTIYKKCMAAATKTTDESTDNKSKTSAANIYQPSSIEAKLKISLGLADNYRPKTPTSASKMLKNWGNATKAQRSLNFKDPDFLYKFKNIFNPTSNDLGIYFLARTDMSKKKITTKDNATLKLQANGGWLDTRTIANTLKGIPHASQKAAEQASNSISSNFAKSTGNAFVDATNTFLNYLALSAFKNLMQHLGSKASQSNTNQHSSYENDPSINYGEAGLKEITSSIIKPNFSVRTDYNVLADLAVCPDSKNPGPNNCVIDNKLMQGITEKKTVIEAIQDGYLHGNWQLTKDSREDSYSLRNVSIMRKYRILPVSWEVAINQASKLGKKVTLMDMVSCFSPNDSYNKFSSSFDVRDQTWCQGLIDPNWVLKAPLNYCKKEGISAQILSTTVISSQASYSDAPATPSSLSIVRADGYCADQQTCIKENNNGSCEVYGYCNGEKRTWDFGTDSCPAVYNTCQTFVNSSTGQKVSYLKNTLNYGECTADNSGCKEYALNGDYDNLGKVDWTKNNSRYFNKNISSCLADAEGCTELLRIKPSQGANLVTDSDFSQEKVGDSSTSKKVGAWPVWTSGKTKQATIVDVATELGGGSGLALRLSATGTVGKEFALGTFSNSDYSLVPKNLEIILGQAYTLSADVYMTAGTKIHVVVGGDDYSTFDETKNKNSWEHISITRKANNFFNEPVFSIVGYSTTGKMTFYIRNVKFEMSSWDTGYSDYGASKTYEKIVPDYLKKACYVNPYSNNRDYTFKADAPSQCYDYARQCNKSEVGCEAYKSLSDDFTVPVNAQVNVNDYCPSDCVGYDSYVARKTNFNPAQAENLIPSKAKSCRVEAVGCNEFTNLDKLSQGGESKEYYTSLKRCVKPSQASCGNFYTWEGTSNGYQLRVYTLEEGNNNEPTVTSNDSALCNKSIYELPIGSPGFNPDCREFYNKSGQVFYHLDSRTVTCSDNCHAYRLSGNNIDQDLNYTECTGTDKHWDANTNSCSVCLNGGTWDNTQKACIYQAIPGEGKTCTAAENGCREYNGSEGNIVHVLAYYDFENGLNGWSSNCSDGVGISAIASNKNGHSLLYNNNASDCSASVGSNSTSVSRLSGFKFIKSIFASDNIAAQVKVGTSVQQDKAYNIKFRARAGQNTKLKIYFYNKNSGKTALFSKVTIFGNNEWQLYQVNLADLDHPIDSSEELIITANGSFYFDDMVITEITDRYYLIKNSSQIPDVCYYDMSDKYQGADYNLGCSSYLDRNNVKHNLHKFNSLCSDSAVGCEQMITTENYSSPQAGIWKDTNGNGICDANEPNCVKVPADQAIYAVYDQDKLCNQADLGCSLAGQGQKTGNGTAWSDVFVKNDPNSYSQTLCTQSGLGCEEWQEANGNSSSYFKDPGSDVCVYRQSKDPTVSGKAWYKAPVKRCDLDGNGKINGTEKTGAICASDTDCDNSKCLAGNDDHLCSTTYFKTIGLGGAGNQVPTPDENVALCKATASGCTELIDPVSRFSTDLAYNYKKDNNKIKLVPNRLYILSSQTDTDLSAKVELKFANSIKTLTSKNTLSDDTFDTAINQATPHILFDSLNNTQTAVLNDQEAAFNLKEAIVNYQLKNNIDKKSCNGLVKFNNGCILFNERSITGANGLASLQNTWNAYASLDGQTPKPCSSDNPSSCNANQLIKVRPDRVCAKWLGCVTYTKDPNTGDRTCYALGECDRLNDKNECASFIDDTGGGNGADASGYSLLGEGDNNLDNMKEVGLNSEAHYDFEGDIPPLSCVRTNDGSKCVFNNNIVKDSLIRQPDNAPTDYPAHGKSYLKVPAGYSISPMSADAYVSLLPGKEYFINYLVNTKSSSLNAKLVIKYINSVSHEEFIDNSGSGWTRKIHNFKTPTFNNPNENAKARIYLEAVNPAAAVSSGNVYYDDINIEPVLEMSKGIYTSRECRLYPTSNSLTCFNKNNNVIKNGLEGYCLQHDPLNPSVCLMWYPVDHITSAEINHSSLGYQGAAPLNYCTEMNANFELVKKIVMRKVYSDQDKSRKGKNGVVNSNIDECKILPAASGGGITASNSVCETFCGDCTNYIALVHNRKENYNYENVYCVPKMPKDSGGIFNGPVENMNAIVSADPGCSLEYINNWVKLNDSLLKEAALDQCYDGDCTPMNEFKNAYPPVRVYDLDHKPADESGLKLLASSDSNDVYNLTCNRFTQVVSGSGENQAWSGRIGLNSNWATTTPPYFVDKINNKYQYFGEYYGSNNSNKTEPSYLGYPQYQNIYSNYHGIVGYGRNREEIPFGGVIWPEGFSLLNSEPVKFRNQYTAKNTKLALAGRPYGCEGAGCNEVGYCSLNPNAYCIYRAGNSSASNYVNKQTCSSGYGTCVPLWKNYLNIDSSINNYGKNDFKFILRNIFLKSYNSYSYDKASYNLSDTGSYDFSQENKSSPLKSCGSTGRPVSSYLDPASNNSFCAVFPEVKNVALYFNSEKIDQNSAQTFNVNSSGVYRLEFNTIVDNEQQPLKSIYIDWGDGAEQVINGQDYRPTALSPHVFYHYYKKPGQIKIAIKIVDNWGYYGEAK